jgi:hypothetical protein
VAYLETLLQNNAIDFQPAEDFNPSFQSNGTTPPSAVVAAPQPRNGTAQPTSAPTKEENERYDREKLTKLVSNIGMVSVQGASDPRYLGSTSGISFARVVFAAVKSSVSGSSSERGSNRGGKATTNVVDSGTSMRDSFFGLQTKPGRRPSPTGSLVPASSNCTLSTQTHKSPSCIGASSWKCLSACMPRVNGTGHHESRTCSILCLL